MKYYQPEVNAQEKIEIAQKILFKMGWKWFGSGARVVSEPRIAIGNRDQRTLTREARGDRTENLEEFLVQFVNPVVKFGSDEVVFVDGNVKIGCQEWSKEQIEAAIQVGKGAQKVGELTFCGGGDISHKDVCGSVEDLENILKNWK